MVSNQTSQGTLALFLGLQQWVQALVHSWDVLGMLLGQRRRRWALVAMCSPILLH